MELRFAITQDLYRVLAALGIFVGLVAGTSIFFETTRLLYGEYGAHAHWAVILVAAPLLAGFGVRLLKIRYSGLLLFAGGIISAMMVYPVYVELWVEPPDLVLAALFAALTYSVARLALVPIRVTYDVLKVRWSQLRYNRRKNNGAARKAYRAAMSRSRRTVTGPYEMLKYSRYSTRIAMLQLLMAVLSLLISVFSIFFLGSR